VFFDSTIFTFGEDSSFCQWSLKDGQKLSWKKTCHEASPIWSANIDETKKLLFTGTTTIVIIKLKFILYLMKLV